MGRPPRCTTATPTATVWSSRSTTSPPRRKARPGCSPPPSMPIPSGSSTTPTPWWSASGRECRWPSWSSATRAGASSAKGEAGVAVRRDLVALLAVLRGAPGGHDEGAFLLAGQVRVDAHHPGVDLGEEHAPAAVVHVLRPRALRLLGSLDPDVTPLPHVPEERGDPVHVLLDAARNVAEGGGVV